MTIKNYNTFRIIGCCILCWQLLASTVYSAFASVPQHFFDVLTDKRWTAHWIGPATASPYDYGVHLFRKEFSLKDKPKQFIIHVSADQRYALFVNGHLVGRGPAAGGLLTWNYETFDIAAHMQPGQNLIAAQVVNYGRWTPGAQMTLSSGLLVQGDSDMEQLVNTGTGWRTIKNDAYSPSLANMSAIDIEPADQITGKLYPWHWQTLAYDDAHWEEAAVNDRAQSLGSGTQYLRALQPRSIPLPEFKEEPAMQIRRSTGLTLKGAFLAGGPITIAPHTKVSLLLDQGYLTNAFVETLIGGGAGSMFSISYAEALYDQLDKKGNRNEVDGKTLRGVQDIIYPAGGKSRSYHPLNFKTFRYIQLDIETKKEPLTLEKFARTFVGYPFEEIARFESSNKKLDQIWRTGWRTARLCAVDLYYDCPYYERLQYTGDTRIQSLISLYVSGDERLMRKAISDLASSMVAEGILQSRYPTHHTQIIPPFSLYWINMLHDYHMHRADPAFVKLYLPTVERIIQWYSSRINPQTGMLGAMPHWNFVDWPDEWPWSNERPSGGVPPGGIEGGSAILSLQLAYTLKEASALLSYFGEEAKSSSYLALNKSLNAAVMTHCYEVQRGLIADDISRSSYSQHANIMGILSGAIPDNLQRDVFLKLDSDSSLIQATVFYRFYLTRAMKKAGLANMYVDNMDIWENMLDLGLSTFAERPEPSRSDCHAWSASPNYDFLATVCGVEPASPGFETVLIQPNLGSLSFVKGEIPHPQGIIKLHLRKTNANLTGEITLPKGLSGVYRHQGRNIKLLGGTNNI
ncbi:alpha-L-rhamnosidase-related protein [Sphingobacterium pedocola]|uniref:Alpha-L-rhamnosidase n=1 Tax=Sphingobacterium pedocola TaxID=2082722 RepID=A0ABR9T9H4_9SPHI|nr:alpha-L-rhamnosidase C-terminal domain-containing protein [Sphingobacterium pedocola]MBE8721973.1 alpha-L-rhamnosidase [Sphingobacterium pedocola]